MTTRTERIERIKREKRNLYLLAAVKTFQEKGFNDTRVKDITNLAGTSVGNFYRYYKGKEEILEFIIKEFYHLMTKEIKTLQDQNIPPIKMIKTLFRSLIKIFKEKNNVALIFIDQMHGINQKYSKLRDKYQAEAIREVKKIISPLIEKKFVRKQNAELTSLLWVEGLFQAFAWWSKNEFKIPDEEAIDYLADFLIWGTIGK